MEQNKKHHFWDPLVSRIKGHGMPLGRESASHTKPMSRHEAHTRESVGVDTASSERPFTERNEK